MQCVHDEQKCSHFDKMTKTANRQMKYGILLRCMQRLGRLSKHCFGDSCIKKKEHMSNFNENTRVQVPAALHLCRLGYTYLDNINALDTQTNIIVDVFLESVKRLNPGVSSAEASILLSKIVSITNNDDLGREFYNLLSTNSGVKLIDFDNPDNNVWHVTTELPCENKETDENFRPDITCFVNGLPLAFIEVKKPNNHEGILAERELRQNQCHGLGGQRRARLRYTPALTASAEIDVGRMVLDQPKAGLEAWGRQSVCPGIPAQQIHRLGSFPLMAQP